MARKGEAIELAHAMTAFSRAGAASLILLLLAQCARAQADDDLDSLLTESDKPAESKSETPAPDAQDSSAPAPAPYPNTIPVATPKEAPLPPDPPDKRRNALIEEIVVTAQKREESINEVPIAISAFSGEQLDALGVTDTRNLSTLVPGFTYADSGYATPIYTLRGIGFNDATYNATSTVGIYVDEVNLPYSVMSKGANLDLERVEVLKGPQGTLYGRNTTGGAINYIAKKPSDTFEAGITGSYGTYRTSDVEGYLTGPLSDSLKGRIAVKSINSSQGWQYSNTRPDDHLGKKDKQSLRGLLDWHASEHHTLNFSISGWRDASEPQAPQVIAITPQNPNDMGTGATLSPEVRNYPVVPRDDADPRVADWSPEMKWQIHERYFQSAIRSTFDVSDTLSLTTIASYADMKEGGSLLPQSGFNVLNVEQKLDARIKTKALESRLSGEWGDSFRWMLGGNLSRDDGNEFHELFVDTSSDAFPDPVTGRSAVGVDRVATFGVHQADQLAGFLHTEWQIINPLKFSLGARYTQDKRKFTGCTLEPLDGMGGLTRLFQILAIERAATTATLPPPIINQGDCITLKSNGSNEIFAGELNEDNVSGRAALDWTPVDDVLAYLSFSRGFKSGGFPVLSSSDQKQYVPVKQEQLHAFELGSKISLLDHALHVNAAAFYYDYKDKQLLTRTLDDVFGPLPILRNAPKSQVIGAELEIQSAPLPGLFVSLAGSYIKTEIKEFTSTGFQGQANFNFAGKPFNFTPKVQGALVMDYMFPLSSNINLGFGGDYSYTGKSNSTLDENPLYEHKAYGLVSVRAKLARSDGAWSVTLWGRNITDQLATISIIQAGDGAARFVQQPRTYGLTLSLNWL
jgi:outer membrane receptor protein involved in Fe transport